MAKVNDIVRFLNATGGGRISRIEGNIAYVEDSDGFEQPVLLRECVVVDASKPKATAYDRPITPAPSKEEKPLRPSSSRQAWPSTYRNYCLAMSRGRPRTQADRPH